MWDALLILTDVLLVVLWGFCTIVNLSTGQMASGILNLILVALWGFKTGIDVARKL